MIGLAAAVMIIFNGRIAGVSGVLGGLLLDRKTSEAPWRALFLGGLMLGALLVMLARPDLANAALKTGWIGMIAAGLIVGFGTRMGSGCTSGHGVVRNWPSVEALHRRHLHVHGGGLRHGLRPASRAGRPVMNLQSLVSLIAGILFGAGLVVGGMTDPGKVIGFLDLAGQWDPSLAFVMGSALCVTLPVFQFVIRKRSRPVLGARFFLPTKTDLDPAIAGGIGAVRYRLGYCRTLPRPGHCESRERFTRRCWPSSSRWWRACGCATE
jgi:uncharacterized membrane protein YedE/YeeE